MKYLRKAAARERRAPIFWWFLLTVMVGGALCSMLWHHSKEVAVFMAILLVGAWFAPLVALLSLSSPPRAKGPPPGPGEGSYDDWRKQTRLLGRMLLYHEDNPYLSKEIRKSIHAARRDLRDTLKSHPLRDDLERVCGRIRSGALKQVKAAFWRENRNRIEDLTHELMDNVVLGLDEDEQLLALHSATEDAAALMARYCMPRMLERERLACAVDCAWLAVQAAPSLQENVSPIELAARLVIEWSDISEPWQPARMLRNVLALMELPPADIPAAPAPVSPVSGPATQTRAPVAGTSPAPADASPTATLDEGEAASDITPAPRRRRVRVRVRRSHRSRHRRRKGPSIYDILLSFGQWIRYSIRAWTLYR